MNVGTGRGMHGIAQRRLMRVKAHWGSQVREHLAMVPLFDSGYKVLGLVGLNTETAPTWYPGIPLVVERRRMVFRSSMQESPPDWEQVPEGLLEHCYFLDTWGAIQVLVPQEPGGPDLSQAMNLAGASIRGRLIDDLVFEPALHRVRAVVLRGRWGRTEAVPVLKLPALAECLEPSRSPPLDVSAFGAPPERPDSWMERVLRAMLSPLPVPGRRR